MADFEDGMEQQLLEQDEAIGLILGPVLSEIAREEEERNEAGHELKTHAKIVLLFGQSSKGPAKKNKYYASLTPIFARHWAVLVDEVVFEMFKDPNNNVMLKTSAWDSRARERFPARWPVGRTRCSRSEILDIANELVSNVQKYNIMTENCQTFAIALSNAIKLGEKWHIRLARAVLGRPLTFNEYVLQLFPCPFPLANGDRHGKRVYALVEEAFAAFERRGAIVASAKMPPASSAVLQQDSFDLVRLPSEIGQ